VSVHMCVCIALCTTVAHNSAQNIPDNFPSYPPDNHHCSDDVYLREGRGLDGVEIPHVKGQFLGEEHARHARTHTAVSCAKMAEQTEMPFGLWTWVGQMKHV